MYSAAALPRLSIKSPPYIRARATAAAADALSHGIISSPVMRSSASLKSSIHLTRGTR